MRLANMPTWELLHKLLMEIGTESNVSAQCKTGDSSTGGSWL